MRSGIPEEELLQAFEACIEVAPDRVTFFPRDFLKWRKVWRDRAVKVRQKYQHKTDGKARQRELVIERERILREREDP